MLKLQRGRPQDQVHGISLKTSRRESGALVALLVVSRILKSFGLFSAAEVVKTVPLVCLITLSTALSAGVFSFLQKPFDGGVKLRSSDYRDIRKHAALRVIESMFFTFGLMIVGPLRAVMISEHSQWAILATAAVTTLPKSASSIQCQSAALGCLSFAILLWFDDPSGGHAFDVKNTGNENFHIVRHDKYFGFLFISDRTAAMLCLLVSAFSRIVRENFGRKISARIGGAKRLNAISYTFAALGCIPVALFELFIAAVPSDAPSILHTIVSIVIFSSTSIVFTFYADKAVSQKITSEVFVSAGLITVFAACGMLEDLFQKEESVEFSTVLSAILIFVGEHRWHTHRSQNVYTESGGGIDLRRRSLVGYGRDGKPLYSLAPRIPIKSILSAVPIILKNVQESSETRQIFYFLVVNFMLMITEFISGITSQSMWLISDAFHMLFDCGALTLGLYAAISVRAKPPKTLPYGNGIT